MVINLTPEELELLKDIVKEYDASFEETLAGKVILTDQQLDRFMRLDDLLEQLEKNHE